MTTMFTTKVDDRCAQAAYDAISSSLTNSLDAHLDTLAKTLSERSGLDVEIARVLLARELELMTGAMHQVAVGRAIARKRTLKDVAAASGAKYASALYAHFPQARSVAETMRGVDSSGTARVVIVGGWRFVLRARTR